MLALVVGVPLAIFMGLFHFKRSQAYSAEVDIGVEANPYYYKVTPGKERELRDSIYRWPTLTSPLPWPENWAS